VQVYQTIYIKLVEVKMTGRISKQILEHQKKIQKKNKQISLIKNLKKEVNIGANGTQNYIIKKGINKGKML
tara:strand:+ start:104 stop:316 length:213 start_codon:yes stop_codon:yes gene_type:complete